MRTRWRSVLLLMTAVLAVSPALVSSRAKTASLKDCERQRDLCRQRMACPVGYDPLAQAALDPPYCKQCEQDYATCRATVLGVTNREVRHSKRKQGYVRKQQEEAQGTADGGADGGVEDSYRRK